MAKASGKDFLWSRRTWHINSTSDGSETWAGTLPNRSWRNDLRIPTRKLPPRTANFTIGLALLKAANACNRNCHNHLFVACMSDLCVLGLRNREKQDRKSRSDSETLKVGWMWQIQHKWVENQKSPQQKNEVHSSGSEHHES